jgi:hypothetical protein
LVLGAGCFFACFLANAADSPFDLEKGDWVSSEGYDINMTRHPPQPEKEPPPVAEAPVLVPNASKPPDSPDNKTSALIVRTPLMPGMNKGFNIEVDTTEDAKEKIAPPAPENSPDIELPDNWIPLPARKALSELKTEEGEDRQPLNIRLTFLPARTIIPLPSSEHESAAKKGHAYFKKSPDAKHAAVPKTPEESAACVALDVFKKQQLDAIQSDRQTLQALQNAIHALGLSKQLGFMTEEGSALNSSENQTPAQFPVTVSVPPETSVK